MNKVILIGRLTRQPELRYSQCENQTAIARYTLAVNRLYQRDGEQEADFISCVAFGRAAEFAEKWLDKGTKIAIVGRIQTGSYTNKDGVRVYTTDVVVESQEFAERKDDNAGQRRQQDNGNQRRQQGNSRQQSNRGNNQRQQSTYPGDDFMNIPDGWEEELPFN